MKCFVAVATLLGLSAGEPFQYGVPMTTSYASVIAPSIHAAPAISSVPAITYTSEPLVSLVSGTPLNTYTTQPIMRVKPVATATIKSEPAAITAQQYHSQDEYGNYAYGYANEISEKHEAGNTNTGVRGHYSYVDGNGMNRRVDYVADDLGFRASGSGVTGTLLRHKRSLGYGYGPYAAPSLVAYPAVPMAGAGQVTTYAPQPIASPVPVAIHNTVPLSAASLKTFPSTVATIKTVPSAVANHQYHNQDELGNYAYGYANENSEKHESSNIHTGVKGHYSYVDAHGLNRRVDYVADDAGFRASGSGVTGAANLLRQKRSLAYGLTSHATPFAHYPFAPAVHASPAVTYVSQHIVPTSSVANIKTIPSVVASQQYHAVPALVATLKAVPSTAATIKTVPSVVANHQYHTQDEFGNYAYGYANENSEKHEAGNAHTGVKGHYSYVDGHGLNRRVDYVADDLGFRATSNL